LSGYLVTRPYRESNVGSNLASLCGALWVAGEIGRTVVVDWRDRAQLQDPDVNYFTEFFAAPERMLDVETIYAPTEVDQALDPRAAWLQPGQADALAQHRAEPPDGPIVLQLYHGPDRLMWGGGEGERYGLLQRFYRELRPAADIEREVERWWHEHVGDSFAVGLNVRTGNGHYFGKGGLYEGRVALSVFENQERFLRVLERACRARVKALPRSAQESFKTFYATDSEWMSQLLARLPGAVTRRRVFPPPGSGDTFTFAADGDYTDRDSIRDTLTDMFLLGRSDAFVFNSSVFNQYARVLNDDFGGNQVHIESLFARQRAKQLSARLQRRFRALRPGAR
jgi:hypothetical protein